MEWVNQLVSSHRSLITQHYPQAILSKLQNLFDGCDYCCSYFHILHFSSLFINKIPSIIMKQT